MKLSDMNNIGKVLEEKLIRSGIFTPDELIETGSKHAFLKIKNIDDSACLSMLCALEGAIQGKRWNHLDDKTKKDLKTFYDTLK